LTVSKRFGIVVETEREKKMKKPKIVRNAERQFLACIVGLAIPCQKKTVDGGFVLSEKVLKFNRTALKNIGKVRKEKNDPRFLGGEDTMRIKVGKPGSDERKAALAEQYTAIQAMGEEVSPFGWEA
jgi:hypothetical protein